MQVSKATKPALTGVLGMLNNLPGPGSWKRIVAEKFPGIKLNPAGLFFLGLLITNAVTGVGGSPIPQETGVASPSQISEQSVTSLVPNPTATSSLSPATSESPLPLPQAISREDAFENEALFLRKYQLPVCCSPNGLTDFMNDLRGTFKNQITDDEYGLIERSLSGKSPNLIMDQVKTFIQDNKVTVDSVKAVAAKQLEIEINTKPTAAKFNSTFGQIANAPTPNPTDARSKAEERLIGTLRAVFGNQISPQEWKKIENHIDNFTSFTWLKESLFGENAGVTADNLKKMAASTEVLSPPLLVPFDSTNSDIAKTRSDTGEPVDPILTRQVLFTLKQLYSKSEEFRKIFDDVTQYGPLKINFANLGKNEWGNILGQATIGGHSMHLNITGLEPKPPVSLRPLGELTASNATQVITQGKIIEYMGGGGGSLIKTITHELLHNAGFTHNGVDDTKKMQEMIAKIFDELLKFLPESFVFDNSTVYPQTTPRPSTTPPVVLGLTIAAALAMGLTPLLFLKDIKKLVDMTMPNFKDDQRKAVTFLATLVLNGAVGAGTFFGGSAVNDKLTDSSTYGTILPASVLGVFALMHIIIAAGQAAERIQKNREEGAEEAGALQLRLFSTTAAAPVTSPSP